MLTLRLFNNGTLLSRLSGIRDKVGKNYQGDTLFIAKLILKDFKVEYNDELLQILKSEFTGELYQDNEIKKYIVSLLPTVSFEFIIQFLGEENLDLIEYLYTQIKETPYSNIIPYILNNIKYTSLLMTSLIKISLPIITLDQETKQILLDTNISIFIRVEIYRKLDLYENDPNYPIIDILPNDLQEYINNESHTFSKKPQKLSPEFKPKECFQNNLWNIEKDGDKKAIIFYLRYHNIKQEFREILKTLIKKVRFEIESGNTDFEKIIIVFRRVNHYDRSLSELIEDGNDVIQFAFTKGDAFQKLINSPNRHIIHFTSSTPEELLNPTNGVSIITEEITHRFNFQQHGITDFIELPWSAHEPKIMDESWYIETFMNCFRVLSPSPNSKINEKIFTILKPDKLKNIT